MRKSIILFLFFLLTTNYGLSKNTNIGLKLGLQTSNINYTNRVETHIIPDKPYIWMHEFKQKLGVNIAVICRYNVTKSLDIGIEPGYIIKGASFDQSDSKLDLHYFSAPIRVGFNLFNSFTFNIGSEISFLINAKLGSIDMLQFYNDKQEISLFTGIEYEINHHVQIGGKLNYGLTKISETKWMNENDVIYGTVGEKSNYTQIYLIYFI